MEVLKNDDIFDEIDGLKCRISWRIDEKCGLKNAGFSWRFDGPKRLCFGDENCGSVVVVGGLRNVKFRGECGA